MRIDAILSPDGLPALATRDRRGTVCVVFDILRATSTFVTALHHGARAIIPVGEIAEAVARRQAQPELLLAGERDGVRISAAQSGGFEFDLGNSPREFMGSKIAGRTIVSTTTNGTRALRACAGARLVLAAGFVNLAATSRHLHRLNPEEILLVCAGTAENLALEDVLAAGALGDLLAGDFSDAAETARRAYAHAKPDLAAALAGSQNARRLLARPDLRADVAFCAQRNVFDLVAGLDADGGLRKI
jgi:2-phosphosulfolactate phosphatase